MNWKKINESYPLAVLDLFRQTIDEDAKVISKIELGWMEVIYGSGYGDFPESVLEDQLLHLPEYFDALGIHVDTVYDSPEYQVFVDELILMNNGEWADKDALYKEDFTGFKQSPTRREALEAGIMKAFEIREERLKQKEK